MLFGGGNWAVAVPGSGGTAYGDTWTWNGATWAQQFPSSAPSARSYFSMAYDGDLGVVVLFGGAVGGDWGNSANDTWMWNGSNWTQIHPATVPPNRYNFGMDYDTHGKSSSCLAETALALRAMTHGAWRWRRSHALQATVRAARRLDCYPSRRARYRYRRSCSSGSTSGI
jgi:hypothetical protein